MPQDGVQGMSLFVSGFSAFTENSLHSQKFTAATEALCSHRSPPQSQKFSAATEALRNRRSSPQSQILKKYQKVSKGRPVFHSGTGGLYET